MFGFSYSNFSFMCPVYEILYSSRGILSFPFLEVSLEFIHLVSATLPNFLAYAFGVCNSAFYQFRLLFFAIGLSCSFSAHLKDTGF